MDNEKREFITFCHTADLDLVLARIQRLREWADWGEALIDTRLILPQSAEPQPEKPKRTRRRRHTGDAFDEREQTESVATKLYDGLSATQEELFASNLLINAGTEWQYREKWPLVTWQVALGLLRGQVATNNEPAPF